MIMMSLLYNRASDDNLLKNIELFDKLAEKHRERGLFIKDVIGSNEICCWTFYGPGGAVKKVAEVCCTSIVYATDKKHTKVRLILILKFSHIFSAHKTYNNLLIYYRLIFQRHVYLKRPWMSCCWTHGSTSLSRNTN